MIRVLIVKMTSMGDIVHTFPAITDAQKAIPDIQFDWVVDESFAELPKWHPAVNQIIISAHRRWRKNIWKSLKNNDLKQFIKQLRSTTYDFVIDAQSNYRSALITRLALGQRCGFDRCCTREKGFVHLAYSKRYHIPFQQHAITRLRKLFSQVLDYPLTQEPPEYNIQSNPLTAPPIQLPENYVIFVHNSSWKSKSWPLAHWRTLLKKVIGSGYKVILPWGSASEKQQAIEIAKTSEDAIVLPKLSLSQFLPIALKAKAAVCMDTGLAQILAGLDIPSVALYGPTDPHLVGTTGKLQVHLTAQNGCSCFYQKVCKDENNAGLTPTCMASIQPDFVWKKLVSLGVSSIR